MTTSEQATLEQALQQLGVPPAKAPPLATQLDKRAHQLAAKGDRTYDQALVHLLQLMRTARDERTKQND